jgi:outer membrane protein W
MDVDNTVGLMATIGASAEIYKNVEIDLSISYMNADVDAKYWLRPEGEDHPRAEWEFPASSIITQLGIRYMF